MTVFDLPILDAHTHLAGSESGESAEGMLKTLDACGVDKAFVFAPLLDVRSWELTDQDFGDIRTHNDYCAHICSAEPERLLGFCVLNPSPSLTNGSIPRAVDLMNEEANRAYHELGLRGAKMVPTNWYPNDHDVLRLYQVIADLHMYVVFHSGIFMDGRESSYCRPSYFEGVHSVKGFKGQIAHLSWPWVDEAIASLLMETNILGQEPENWDLIADISFGSPDDWQLDAVQKAIDTLSPEMLAYGSDIFWPVSAEEYREKYLQPQLGLFETAVTLGHVASEGSGKRADMRRKIFHDNVWRHYQAIVRDPQRPCRSEKEFSTTRASKGHDK